MNFSIKSNRCFISAGLTTVPGLVSLILFLFVFLFMFPGQADAKDYVARKSGDWMDPKTWKPRGVPGAGDRVRSIGSHDVRLAGSVTLGVERASEQIPYDALILDAAGSLTIAPQASLTLHGHLLMSGEGARLQVEAGASVLFAPAQNHALQLKLFASGQRIEFVGVSESRGEIGRAANAKGHWFVASEGHRDSVLSGSYGRISDALDPSDNKGWSMYLADQPQRSSLVANNIEFVRCGQIGVFGLDAGESTRVDIFGWTFKDSPEAAADLPAFWFDGYGDIVVAAPNNKTTKRIRNLVSDKEIYVRYVQGYVLENWVLGANGKPGHVRTGNNGGNALVQRDVFQVVKDSGGVGLVADLTENVYMYAEADNPHGFDTRHLRGDATLRNFWFESHFANQSDTGDAVLTNGPQSWGAEHGGPVVTLTIEHSASIGDTSAAPTHPVFLTLNNAEGMNFRLRNNFMRQPVRFNSVALDENGETPPGTGKEFANNLIYSPVSVEGYALGSASAKAVVHSSAFSGIKNNLYFNLRPRTGDYPKGPLAFARPGPSDVDALVKNPRLRDPMRNLAQWDLLLGGPGTAEHAVAELLKMNDDSGFDPAYRVGGLIAFVRSGFAPTNPELLDDSGYPVVGPALVPVSAR